MIVDLKTEGIYSRKRPGEIHSMSHNNILHIKSWVKLNNRLQISRFLNISYNIDQKKDTHAISDFFHIFHKIPSLRGFKMRDGKNNQT